MSNAGKPCTESDYFKQLNEGTSKLLSRSSSSSVSHLMIDCANGVGAEKIESVIECIVSNGTVVTLKNTGDGVLNSQCGADFVQKEKKVPQNFEHGIDPECLCLSLDGDADRIVFFSQAASSCPLELLDGDKILCLIASHLKSHVSRVSLESSLDPKPTMGVIQTAYANGSSTRFLESELGLNVVKTKTGVKHLHKAALDFDVSVYFEANGHGTVLFADTFLESLRQLEGNESAEHLLNIATIVNPSIGDALSILLLVYVILTEVSRKEEEEEEETEAAMMIG